MLSFGEIHNSRHNLQEIITEKNVNKIRQQIKTPSLSDKRLQPNKSQLISSQLKFKNWPYWLLWSIKRWPPDSYCPTHSLKSSQLTAVKKLFLLKASLSETWPSAWRKTHAQNMFALYDLCGMAFCKNGLDLHKTWML